MHEKLVNSNKYTDLTFVLPNDQRVTAHSFIVEIRCPKLLTTNITEKKKGKYYIASTNYLSQQELLVVLHYIYSGTLPTPEKPFSVRVLLSLCKCAEEYSMDGLTNDVSKLLWSALDPKNIARASKIAAEVNTAKGSLCCELWRTLHWTEEKPLEMVEPSATQVKEAQLKYNKLFKPHSVDPMWHAHWEVILKQMNNPDFLIVNSDETEEGACHRCVLSGHSPQLADLVARSENELFSSLSAIAIEMLLRWIYFYSPCTDYNIAAEILPFAYEFGITNLISECEDMLSDCVDETTVFWILQIIVTTNNQAQSKLKVQCLDFIVENLPTVDFQVLREMPVVVAQEVIKAIQKSVGVQWIPDKNTAGATITNSASGGNTYVKAPPTTSLIPAAPMPSSASASHPTLPEKSESASGALHANNTLKTGSSSPRSTSGALSDTSADPTSPITTSSSNKPAVSAASVGAADKDKPDGESTEETDSVGASSEESFHIPKFLPEPQGRGRESPLAAPQYKKKKKISGVKDLDDLFGF